MSAFILIVVIAIVLSPFFAERGRYRDDTRNPYRRYCADCGQQQDRECYSWDLQSYSSGWWTAMGALHDPKCPCHKDCRQ